MPSCIGRPNLAIQRRRNHQSAETASTPALSMCAMRPSPWLSIRARTLSSNRPADQASLHARRTSTANAKNPVMDFGNTEAKTLTVVGRCQHCVRGDCVRYFHAVGSSDRGNRVVILTGSGNAFMETISPEGFDFFTPQGYDKI